MIEANTGGQGREGRRSMLLKPAVTKEAALEWLKARAIEAYDIEITGEIEKRLAVTAEAMAEISATDLGEEIEPLLL